jgi:hypothetical protein
MHHFTVMMDAVMMHLVMPMLCRLMPMLRRVVRMPNQGLARAVPKPLPMGHAAAPAFGLARETRGVVMGVPPCAAMGLRRTAARMGSSTAADVDPAVRRARSRHRGKGRRGLGSGLRVRRRGRWNFRRGLLRRRERLVGRGLLRGSGRSENPECQSSANERGTMHDRLHLFMLRIATAEG